MLPPQRSQRLFVHFENHAVRQLECKTSPKALRHDLLRQFLIGAIVRPALLRQLLRHELKSSEAVPFRI